MFRPVVRERGRLHQRCLARIIHRFLSRSGESAAMTRRATKGPAGVLMQHAEEPKEAQRSQRG